MRHFFYLSAILVIAGTSCKTKSGASSSNNTSNDAVITYTPPADGITRTYTATVVPNPDTIRLSDGIKYILKAKGNGPAITCGDKANMTYVGKLMNDTVFDATYLHGNTPFGFTLCAHQVIAGWDSVVLRLHGGDVAEMFLPAKYAYGARQMGKIPANSPMKFLVEVISIVPAPKLWDAKGKDTITTKDGLKVVFFESHPDAVQAQVGNTVSLDYSGFLLDGTMFDSSIPRGKPFSFVLGKHQVIPGWDEGVAMLHKGDKAKFIIPYQLGYGEQGYANVIPPKATLIFDVQLIDVK
ncbi:MAG TPA: FKBP-type peptidyl-prolyl cis-trans isomerase [Bacteroidia bacterium]|jgi:peptidylprolyl isomerase|nr:FKBP-type peptidyl-prolyl cis-trans isomerase [Bacteroidia bacterium]